MMELNEKEELQGGKYIIQRILERREYYVTYLAKRSDGELRVIKTLNPSVLNTSDQDEQDRLKRLFWEEAVRTSKLSGTDHIATVEMPFEEEGVIYLPMEHFDSHNLAERSQRILSEKKALEYIWQIGKALEVVHEQGMVHRDICPANIFLRVQGKNVEAVLANFGLALDTDTKLSRTRTQECRSGFSPIELYSRGNEVKAYTDIYSLAATLYELLTGKVPVSANEREPGNKASVSPQVENPEISGRTAEAIIAGMELSPEKRPQSVKDWFKKLKLDEPPIDNSSSNQVNWEKWGVIIAALALIIPLLGGISGWLIEKLNPSTGSLGTPPTQSSP